MEEEIVMKKRKSSIITGLDRYGLTASSLFRLGLSAVLVRVHVLHPNQKRLFNLPPDKRKERMDELKRRHYETLLEHWPGEKPQRIGSRRSPSGLLGWLAAKDFAKLSGLPIESIWVEKIEGRKPVPKKRGSVPNYYGIWARYAIQVEGYRSGMQSYEERILLVRANTAEEAEEIVRKDSAGYAEPYLNPNGEMVCWALEKIVDIYDTGSSEVTKRLFEVYSELRSRRMKPERGWNPVTKKM
jgi:hypothetical protein